MAIKDGGPAHAIGVRNGKAPGIAWAAADVSGWRVARSSHKLRNPDNAPDAHITAVNDDFVAREDAGELAKSLSQAEIVEEAGQKLFRFVKAIPTAHPCLNGDGGDDGKQGVVEKLAEYAPADAVRGFGVA